MTGMLLLMFVLLNCLHNKTCRKIFVCMCDECLSPFFLGQSGVKFGVAAEYCSRL